CASQSVTESYLGPASTHLRKRANSVTQESECNRKIVDHFPVRCPAIQLWDRTFRCPLPERSAPCKASRPGSRWGGATLPAQCLPSALKRPGATAIKHRQGRRWTRCMCCNASVH